MLFMCRPPPTSLKNIRRQKTMSDLRPHSMGAEPSVTTLEEQLEQSIKEKERLFKTNQDLEVLPEALAGLCIWWFTKSSFCRLSLLL